ncbi:MAG: hypothetical protein GTO41_15215, partial [Burkholderiales bacterium]|nr:hypothetical protein [Burkholderiales bacterium]
PVETFVSLLRDSISPSKTKLVFFEVPALEIILREQRFWDVYYEHCSYFTRTCLQNLFLRNGFKVIGCEYAFAQQYLLLFARPVNRQLSDSSDKNFAPTAAGVADGADCEILVPSFSRQ